MQKYTSMGFKWIFVFVVYIWYVDWNTLRCVALDFHVSFEVFMLPKITVNSLNWFAMCLWFKNSGINSVQSPFQVKLLSDTWMEWTPRFRMITSGSMWKCSHQTSSREQWTLFSRYVITIRNLGLKMQRIFIKWWYFVKWLVVEVLFQNALYVMCTTSFRHRQRLVRVWVTILQIKQASYVPPARSAWVDFGSVNWSPYIHIYNPSNFISQKSRWKRRWIYRQISNIRRTNSHKSNVSRLVLQLSVPNPLKPGIKLRMKM